MGFFPRNPLPESDAETVCDALQPVLVALIAMALQAKQAHWNVYGTQFLSVHEKLDDVVESARKGVDIVAERMAQLGRSPDGRVATVHESAPEAPYPAGFQDVPSTLTLICDRLHTVTKVMHEAIEVVGDPDPPTEDYLNAITQELEEHLWMLQAMEQDNGSAGEPSAAG